MDMLIDAVATHARARPRALACVDLESGRRWSYREFDRQIDRVTSWLIDELGPASGLRVATLARNRGDMLILNLACVRAGAIFVPFNWRLSTAEIATLINDAEPAILFRDGAFAVPDFDGSLFDLSELETMTAECAQTPPASARRPVDATSTLLYTSGTSGRPKGVQLSEANAFWSQLNFNIGNGVWARSVFLCDMPLFHTAGLLANARAPLLAGGAVLISAGFDADKTLARLADPEWRVSHYFSVPQMAQMLWNHPRFDPQKLRGLQVYATGGAPNPPAQIERFTRAGIRMSEGFGMSETGSNFGMPVDDPERVIAKAGSCGMPYLSTQVRICDHDGKALPEGEAGELWLRGPSVTQGYWQQPELTDAAFADGWFKSGDIAYRDADGFYFIVDRKKDMFISGGENVYPAEVEATIAEMPCVAEVAVVGVPDEHWGEKGVAFLVPVAGRSIDAADVSEYCATKLAKYKLPGTIIITDSLPRTASGKVRKQLLIERATRL